MTVLLQPSPKASVSEPIKVSLSEAVSARRLPLSLPWRCCGLVAPEARQNAVTAASVPVGFSEPL